MTRDAPGARSHRRHHRHFQNKRCRAHGDDKPHQRGLKLGLVAQGNNAARRHTELPIRRWPVHAAALAGDNGNKAIAARIIGAQKTKARAKPARGKQIGVE
jgi:hypothetical protein